MAKLNVGGTDGLIDRFITRVGWQASADVNSDQRKQALKILDACEKYISQYNGLEYRRVRSSFSLAALATTATIPSDMDTGTDFAIEHPTGHGKIEVLPPDRFANEPTAIPYDRIDKTPVKCMVAIDPADSMKKFFFRFSNTTGGALTYPIVYQAMVVNLIDATVGAGSVSLLPEGYEITLLLPCAEQLYKSRKSYPSVDILTAETHAALESFYDKYRTNKNDPVTDTNKTRRKVDSDQLVTLAR